MIRHRMRQKRAGFSMLDSLVAISIMTVAVGGLGASVIASMQLSRVNEEKAIAVDAAHAMIEQLHTMQFDEIFAVFNTAGADDPEGPNTAQGANFAIRGLQTQPGDADGMAGQIEFPTSIDKSGKLVLREDLNDPGLQLPRDLNGDGLIDPLDHSSDYLLLPVRIRVTWRGAGGGQMTFVEALLVE